jgi:hypothetical protein
MKIMNGIRSGKYKLHLLLFVFVFVLFCAKQTKMLIFKDIQIIQSDSGHKKISNRKNLQNAIIFNGLPNIHFHTMILEKMHFHLVQKSISLSASKLWISITFSWIHKIAQTKLIKITWLKVKTSKKRGKINKKSNYNYYLY